ncbi:MAG: response regulator transcription factor [Erysipelotrichaceae bacterium]|nr:response regulator transcription factor [Erysipelotrichaceae bacterium]
MTPTILIADDEKEIRMVLKLYLENAGYHVLEASDGQMAMDIMNKETVDLCLLDIMMPKKDGFQVLKEMRHTYSIPVIILSARDQDSDKILGLDLGADDYIVKPFNPLEAVARVNSNMRRWKKLGAAQEDVRLLACRDLVLDPESCTLKKGNEIIDLTSVEYRIMALFMEHPGKVFTKQQIYEHGWNEDYVIADNNIMVCISKLRAKLSQNPSEYIKTIRGLGYRLEKG